MEKEVKELSDLITSELKKLNESNVALKAAIDVKAGSDKIEPLIEKAEKAEKDYNALALKLDQMQLDLKDQKMGGKKISMFDGMKSKMTDKAFIEEVKKGRSIEFELKASTMDEAVELSNSALATAVIVPFREAVIGKAPDRRILMLDAIQRANISSNRVSWVERSARTEGGAAVAEQAQYGQSDLTYIQRTAPVEKIGTFLKVTNEALEDWDQLLSEISNELIPQLERYLEAQIYKGTGVSPQLMGIAAAGIAAAYTATGLNGQIITPNHMDAIRAAVMQLALANFYPTHVFINPVDGAMMDLPKNADGIYLLPPFVGLDRRVIAGVRVVESNLVAADDFLCGDFTKDTLFTQRGIVLKIWDQDSTDPEYDLKTITASLRSVNRIKVPDYNAFVYDTFSAVIGKIKNA